MTRDDRGVGNGEVCLIDPAHGRTFALLPSGREWCAHTAHDRDRTPAFIDRQRERPAEPAQDAPRRPQTPAPATGTNPTLWETP